MKKRMLGLLLVLAIAITIVPDASAKTTAAGQTVDVVLFYIANDRGEEILVSQIPVSEMEADMQAGKISAEVHNYSILDRFVTTVHQEAQGFTAGEFITYAKSKSGVAALKSLPLSFDGTDELCFWEIDQTGYDELDAHSYDELYGAARYNFPLLYEYWNYTTQDYYDPAGAMTRDEVIEHIFKNGESAAFILSVRAFSQRYIITDEKYTAGDYNMENYWSNSGLLDNERTLRIMKPMTEEELRNKTSTAADTRFWVANILLDMTVPPAASPLGSVSAPTAVMTEDARNYYIRFSCATDGAAILYNHNFISPSYTPTGLYGGSAVIIPKSDVTGGTVTMTCRAVKDGYTDAGVQTLTLRSSGEEASAAYGDVFEDSWYYEYVRYVTDGGLFDLTGDGTFSPEAPMTRAMLASALYRHAGSPDTAPAARFTDVAADADYARAVAWAFENGVVNGTGDNTFSPDGSITREQIAAMFHRYAGKTANADMTVTDDLTAFTDVDSLSDYAVVSMSWAVAAGLITGITETTLAPRGTATRAQAAALVTRLAEYIA